MGDCTVSQSVSAMLSSSDVASSACTPRAWPWGCFCVSMAGGTNGRAGFALGTGSSCWHHILPWGTMPGTRDILTSSLWGKSCLVPLKPHPGHKGAASLYQPLYLLHHCSPLSPILSTRDSATLSPRGVSHLKPLSDHKERPCLVPTGGDLTSNPIIPSQTPSWAKIASLPYPHRETLISSSVLFAKVPLGLFPN